MSVHNGHTDAGVVVTTNKRPIANATLRRLLKTYVEKSTRYRHARAKAFVELFEAHPTWPANRVSKYVAADDTLAQLEYDMELARVDLAAASYVINGVLDVGLTGGATYNTTSAGS